MIEGALTVQETAWPQAKDQVDITGLGLYEFSKKTTLRFCKTCSSLMFYEQTHEPKKLGVFTGVLKNVNDDLIKFTDHIYVGDTIDGGASVWYRRPNKDGAEIPRLLTREDEVSWNWPGPVDQERIKRAEAQDSLPLWCHCKGINLRLHRGDYANVPRDQLPDHVDPRTNKFRASFDACDSCRLQFGNDMVNWTFTELKYLTQADGGDFPDTAPDLKAAVEAGDPSIGTLALHKSSPDVQRYFCKVCSASAFYAYDGDPGRVDIAVGLLEAIDGARAESFLSWAYGDDPSYVEDMKGGWREGLAQRVQRDAEEFRVAKGYPKSWRRLKKESELEQK